MRYVLVLLTLGLLAPALTQPSHPLTIEVETIEQEGEKWLTNYRIQGPAKVQPAAAFDQTRPIIPRRSARVEVSWSDGQTELLDIFPDGRHQAL